jgi:hypothetical protein
MKLKTVFIRFYKSFNYDWMRKAHPDYTPHPWDKFRNADYPYIRVAMDAEITTVVGANESGKSHLLSAIRKGITGLDFTQRDLCRYCPFFNVEVGTECWPHVGLEWSNIGTAETAKLRDIVPDAPEAFSDFLMFRQSPTELTLYFRTNDDFIMREVAAEKVSTFGAAFLPQPFEIKSKVALPDFVPFHWLANEASSGTPFSRKMRSDLFGVFDQVKHHWSLPKDQFNQQAPNLYSQFQPIFASAGQRSDSSPSSESLALARQLLVRLAGVDPQRLRDLFDAIADGADGHANALVTSINEQLARKLNFPKWWAQDRDFSLRITPREFDLVFTIRDRTGTEYTFEERSSGLKYFLSYLIQSRAHERSQDRPEILLMDEPDAYLSAEAQQDLLKIFSDFARPEESVAPIQVVFVTHSPFLIDKNHADRIRVLEKGVGLIGTRVIRNVSQNHYEPMRSAFGAFVGETAFIGACNLLVEGTADQILLAGAARQIRRGNLAAERQTIDLNRLVIVPCGSASQVPYMLYLIRGRDKDKPPVVVLLDSDKEGTDAAKLLKDNTGKMSRLIKPAYVLQIGNLSFPGDATNLQELEDLIPKSLALTAANRFLGEVTRFHGGASPIIAPEHFEAERKPGLSQFKALNAAANRHGIHLDKIGFARAVVELCADPGSAGAASADVDVFLNRMKSLFENINAQRRAAERDSAKERMTSIIERHQRAFLRDHATQATKEEALEFLEALETELDDSMEADAVKTAIGALKRDFQLDDTSNAPVGDYANFSARISALKHSYQVSQQEVGSNSNK